MDIMIMEDGDFSLGEDVGYMTVPVEAISPHCPQKRKFISVSESDTEPFVINKRNKNTVRKTETDVSTFMKYLQQEGETREMKTIPPTVLNLLLSRYILSVRRNNGDEYEPDTLRSMLTSVNRRLQENDYPHNIMTDVLFKHCRDVLCAKRKDLKEKGLGNRKNKALAYTENEISILWDQGLLGASNPDALTNTMWFNMTTHFILRGRQEHNSMLWGDIELNTTSDGSVYLEFNERATKTRSGASSAARRFPPKMFADPGNPRCPVSMYLEYKKRRPAQCLEADSRFYLQANHSKNPKNPEIWYKDQPMGRDSIGSISKNMSQKAGFQGKKTNHGGRRTALATLTHANIPPNNIIQLSGHRNTMSLNEYSELSVDQQKEMSLMLTNLQKSSSDEVDNITCSDVVVPSEPASVSDIVVSSEPASVVATPQSFPVQMTSDGINVESYNTQMPNMSLFFGGAAINSVNIYTAANSYMQKDASC